jgi:GTP-binding protein LepA
MKNIRNFCIIAHIDHGKSTLADRLLESTGTIAKRDMKDQLLDTMDLERERGITIKLQPVRMSYTSGGTEYELNLIDTPGHVDFNYEVSRSLAAVEGALLLVDATQGVQAQTLGNLYLALEQNLTVIPVVNKIDLPNAEVERTEAEIVNLLGCKKEDIIHASGKTGAGVPEILESVVSRVPPPVGQIGAPLRALIFDSKYDEFKGVIAFVRVIDGEIKRDEPIKMMATKARGEILEVGCFKPKMLSLAKIGAGEIGYIATGLKNIESCRVGDTIAAANLGDLVQPLQGYKEVKPMVFAGLFPKEGSNFERLREAIMKLKMNDAALSFEPESSAALGFGFRCGMLGLLHLEIIQERLRREYNMELVVTVPSVAYKVLKTDGTEIIVKSPVELPSQTHIGKIREPWVKVDIITPKDYLGNIMALVTEKRGIYKNTEYLASGYGSERAILHYEVPLSGILVDFYDKLKSASSGYASLNYEIIDYRNAEVERMDILVAEEMVEAFSTIVYSDEAQRVGRKIVESLKEALPRQMFEVKIQAALGGKIVAAERISAMKKDVLAKMSGGDWTRKAKLLKKQKQGKKKMMGKGHVDIPTEAFLAVLKR